MRTPATSSAAPLFSPISLTIITMGFCGLFTGLRYGLHLRHEYSVFMAFFVLPFLLLSAVHPDRTGNSHGKVRNARFWAGSLGFTLRSLGGPDRGFIEGLALYLVFTGYVFAYYLHDPGFFAGYRKEGLAIPVWLFLISLNVMPMDFYTKRFIQHPLSLRYGSRTAVTLQTGIWLVAHIPESIWLGDLMGVVGVWVFLGVTGLLTGISYERTNNVLGMMVGHVMINGLVLVMARC